MFSNGTVAQWLEQATHNRLVGGSNPSSPTSSLTWLGGEMADATDLKSVGAQTP
jgi:hypothetical protein